ncbi:CDP-alcohol phosphatidyltransferase family protein [Corynebacterium poyangense]|nr:CDP-alcohol phosphatidyltransferase family protein [Corynebacterium poyangense]
MVTVSPSSTRYERLRAWGVHALTLSGLLWATLAMFALIDGQIRMMWLWLGISLIVDGVDGSLARKCRVKEIIPWFNGSIVDHVVDFLTWTAIPAFFIALHLPLGPRPIAIAFAVLILISSCFCYANELAKSTDHYFVGFPAAWNIVAVLLWVWQAPMAVCIISIILLSILTLVPLHYTHPFRVKRSRSLNIALTFIWIATTGVLITLTPPQPPLLAPDYIIIGLISINVLAGTWLLLPGFRRTFTGADVDKTLAQ